MTEQGGAMSTVRRAGLGVSSALAAVLLLAACSGQQPPANPSSEPSRASSESQASVADISTFAPSGAPEQDDPPSSEKPKGPNPILQVVKLNDWYSVALVDRQEIEDPHELVGLIKPLCDGLTVCRVGVWYDDADLPRKLPISLGQMGAQAFGFGRIYNGTENILWNCDRYPEIEAEHACLPREMK